MIVQTWTLNKPTWLDDFAERMLGVLARCSPVHLLSLGR
jgi:hypothetical protein